MDSKLQRVGEVVSDHMSAILDEFKPGAKITVLVRRPGEPEQDFMMTSDDPGEAIAMIERRIAAFEKAVN